MTLDLQAELEGLERRWRRRLELQQRESAKKAAASAAAAAAATGRGPAALANTDTGPTMSSSDACAGGQNAIVETAAWLDRARSLTRQPSDDIQAMPRNEIMTQMEEVQRLLHEGPTAGQPPAVVDQAEGQASGGPPSPPAEPADKRLRTGAEDAEALVGFLRSVRAAAAAGQNF